MKTTTLFLTFFALPALALAGFRLPAKVFEVGDLEKAKAEAILKKKPIAVLYSDKDTTCPLCSDASQAILRELGSKTVMVYVSSKSGLPASVIDALNPGKFIPKVAVLDAGLEKSLGTVTYEAIKENPRQAFRDVEKAIRAYTK